MSQVDYGPVLGGVELETAVLAVVERMVKAGDVFSAYEVTQEVRKGNPGRTVYHQGAQGVRAMVHGLWSSGDAVFDGYDRVQGSRYIVYQPDGGVSAAPCGGVPQASGIAQSGTSGTALDDGSDDGDDGDDGDGSKVTLKDVAAVVQDHVDQLSKNSFFRKIDGR